MFSWLNFEELLIHNPVELINPSKDIISVAMSKKQYIEFFSNKYTYNGLYYDEEMDFCLFYYADPLQSYKEGDVYAQGYIDVEMKIYRVKWLCNVSISLSSGLLQSTDGTQGVAQEGGKYTHTAWAYSSDGADRFSTVYPRFNLLEGSKDFSGDWWNSTAWDKNGTYNGLTVMSYNGNYNAGIAKGFTIPSDGIYSLSMIVKVKTGCVGKFIVETYKPTTIPPVIIDVTDTGGKFVIQSYTGSFKAGQEIAMYFRFNNGAIVKGCLEVAGHKIEHGETPTPYMQSENETTKADRPSYIGQYTDYTLEDSTNPSSYTWREIREDKWNVTKTGMLVSPQNKQITMVQAGVLMNCGINNNISGWTDGTTQLNYSGQDFIIDGYGMRGLHNG
ncbi:capsid and scaffold protein [Lactococcus phage CHPC116]|uniref:Capsid and scaffold protein n=1 Tax=Lactococcus phage CHPC116 TaxID=2675238 RepID=A0A650ES96_9CAUD|nr:virion structural protein [Lactococcus phage CHPC116]QGT52522.1 capsid and scaffold protein [Lactococcus phage CHPC116]